MKCTRTLKTQNMVSFGQVDRVLSPGHTASCLNIRNTFEKSVRFHRSNSSVGKAYCLAAQLLHNMPSVMKRCSAREEIWEKEEGTLKGIAVNLPIVRRNYCSVLWRKLFSIQIIFFPSSLFSPYISQHHLLHQYLLYPLHWPHQLFIYFF